MRELTAEEVMIVSGGSWTDMVDFWSSAWDGFVSGFGSGGTIGAFAGYGWGGSEAAGISLMDAIGGFSFAGAAIGGAFGGGYATGTWLYENYSAEIIQVLEADVDGGGPGERL